ncbi:M23/M56 family metallopeptidase [Aliikangiella coralliicola]|uniref:Peptidoglycan DD-metalloendopeptidase family protein n=1 Tax=Aliikangiella coralliicola TaxID=2592383 RepID=A0A545UJ07_9GAMM|nr:M23/M56 family metallopeptidase [Aliikangiella coralliicola]TQV89449.1 peptidoglycan DD-metalloendopeptidase family protein [Aliikangiella coralliicola]
MLIFVQLVIFLLWSGLVFLFANLAYRKKLSVSVSPEFWLVCFGVCFLPLIPLPVLQQTIQLPQSLSFSDDISQVIQSVQNSTTKVSWLEEVSLHYWLIGFFALFSLKGLAEFYKGMQKTRKIIRQSKLLNAEDIFTEKQKELLHRYQIKTKVTAENISPFSFGFFKAYLILPKFALAMPREQLKLLVDHELNHIRRRDNRWLILIKLITGLVSFNPFFKKLEQHYINAIELRCDEDVLSDISDINERKKYAQAMLTCLKNCIGIKEQALVAHFSNPETGLAFYQTRLKAIMSRRLITVNRKRLSLTIALMVFSGLSLNLVSANYSGSLTDNFEGWQLPLKAIKVTSSFGEVNPIRNNHPHGGVDLKAAIGTSVYAVKSGVVKIANDTSLSKNYGKVVVVQHSNGYQSLYAHLDGFSVNENDRVIAGQKIGFVGITGKTTGPHLHFELLQGERRLNPVDLLPF